MILANLHHKLLLKVAEWLPDAIFHNVDDVSSNFSVCFFCAPDVFSDQFAQIVTIFSTTALLSLFGSVFLDIHVTCT